MLLQKESRQAVEVSKIITGGMSRVMFLKVKVVNEFIDGVGKAIIFTIHVVVTRWINTSLFNSSPRLVIVPVLCE